MAHVRCTIYSQVLGNETTSLCISSVNSARGACNASLIAKENGVKGVVTHSSGNHGQALAWAASQGTTT